MNIDIATTFKVFFVLIGIAIAASVILAIRSIQAGRKLTFFRKRQDLIQQGWRLILLTIILGGAVIVLARFGEPVAYRYFPPSPTVTLTPTITVTPTITLTPSQTFTPTITLTLAQTYTPAIPAIVQTSIKTPVGVDTKAVFSVVEFSTQTKDGVVINTASTFRLPITEMYGGYSFDKMANGVQWTAVWLYEGQVFCFETEAWKDAPGGYGYTNACNNKLNPVQWKPGEYEVQIFVGQTFKNSGRFSVIGTEPAPTASPTLPNP
jgi:hypothetical protein